MTSQNSDIKFPMKVQFVKVFNRAVASVELTRLSFVCIQKIGFGIRFTA